MNTDCRPAAPLGPRPALHTGDRLNVREFQRRLTGHEGAPIELIGGVVFITTPPQAAHDLHRASLQAVLTHYASATPGIEAAQSCPVILGDHSLVQPDLLLRRNRTCGGQSHYNEEQYLVAAPELVAEIAHSTVAIDMNTKRDDYLAAGVQEYLVYCVEEEEIHWFHFPSKTKLKPDRNGVWKSQVFPGLWLDGPAFVARDSTRLAATVQQGLASAKHAAFVKQLEKRRTR